MKTPILLIHFNRPDMTRRQIEILARIQPERIWVLTDGARANHPDEVAKIAAVRAQFESLPWPCEVTRLFREANLGVSQNISNGISWFFEQVDRGIILEDDCLPDASFFPFCHDLLERYADSERVFSISGYTGKSEDLPIEESYCFSNYFSCWGWATWRRAWKCYDAEMAGFADPSEWKQIKGRLHPNLRQQLYWKMIFNRVMSGRTDSWAYRFLLSMWRREGVAITPRRNMIENCGFGSEATNTAGMKERDIEAVGIDWPLQHPELPIRHNTWLDRWIEDNCHSKSLSVRFDWLRRKAMEAFRSE
ncbi:hypothetical protein ACWPKO_01310 [Coraliomargarita sp. W4R53]